MKMNADNQQAKDTEGSNKWRVNRKFLPLKLFYFFFYGASGSVIPFIGIYLKHLHLTASETGVIAGMAVLFAMCMRPLIGMAADRMSAWRLCLSICCFGFGFAFFCLWFLPGRHIDADKSSKHLMHFKNSTLQQNSIQKVWKCFDPSESVICAYPTIWNQTTCHIRHPNNVSRDITPVQLFANQSLERLISDLSNLSLTDEVSYSFSDHNVGFLNADKRETPDLFYQPCFYIDSINYLTLKTLGDLEDNTAETSNDSVVEQSTRQTIVNCLQNCSLHVLSDIISLPEDLLDPKESNKTNAKETKKVLSSGNITLDYVFVISFILIAIARSFYASSTSLADAVTYTILGPRSLKWGQQRLWGTLGTATAVMTITITNDRLEGENFTALFFVCIGLSLLASVVGGLKLGPKKLPKSERFCADLSRILSQNTTRVFLAKLLFFGMLCGTANNFFFWFLVDLGTNQTTLGLVVLVHCLTSVLVLRFTGLVLKRLGHVRTLYLVALAYALRYLAFSLLTSPLLALPVEILHGVTYSMLWATASSTASIVAPPGTQATCQGIAGAVYWDLGRGLGALLTGQILETLSAPWTFRLYSGLCALALPVFVVLDRRWPLHHASGTQGEQVITKGILTTDDSPSRLLLLNLGVHSNHNNNDLVDYNEIPIKTQNLRVEMNGNDHSATDTTHETKQKYFEVDKSIPEVGNMVNDLEGNTTCDMFDMGRDYSEFDTNSYTKVCVVSVDHSQLNFNSVNCNELRQNKNNEVKDEDIHENDDEIIEANGVITQLTPEIHADNTSISQAISKHRLGIVTDRIDCIPTVKQVSEVAGNAYNLLTNDSLVTEYFANYPSDTLKHTDGVLHTNTTKYEDGVLQTYTARGTNHDSMTEHIDSCEPLTFWRNKHCKKHAKRTPESANGFSFDPTEYQDFVEDVNRFRPKSDSLIPNLSHSSTESIDDVQTEGSF
ncbi:hypothetical protein Btru_066088 [Bulinus truncatus]|nr:hypothetical protein Btru_066088 [Bulinus truncatus]